MDKTYGGFEDDAAGTDVVFGNLSNVDEQYEQSRILDSLYPANLTCGSYEQHRLQKRRPHIRPKSYEKRIEELIDMNHLQ